MENRCVHCNKVFKEGEWVEFRGRSTYHVLKSAVAFALEKTDLQVISPLIHEECAKYEEL